MESTNKKMGAKTIITEKGDVIYEVEDEEGSVKKVTPQEALKEIYKYMHGECSMYRISTIHTLS